MVKAKPRGGLCVQWWSLHKVGGYWLFWGEGVLREEEEGASAWLWRRSSERGGRDSSSNTCDAPHEEEEVKVVIALPAEQRLRLLLRKVAAAAARGRERAGVAQDKEEGSDEACFRASGARGARRAPPTGHRST